VRVQTKETIFANKIVALWERMANRDIYDAYFFFQQLFSINEMVVKERTGKSVKEILSAVGEQLKTLPNTYKILDGLGEVLTEKQKMRVKKHLITELIGMLEMITNFQR